MNIVLMPKLIILIVIIPFNYKQATVVLRVFLHGTQIMIMTLIVFFRSIGKNEYDASQFDVQFIFVYLFSDLELERQREKEAQRQVNERIQSKVHYQQKQHEERPRVTKSDQIAQTDHQVDRVVYIDDSIQKVPSVATKAFVRNLNSSSVQQHMSWDSESVYSQRTNSDMFVLAMYLFLEI